MIGIEAEVMTIGDVDKCIDRFVVLMCRPPKPEEQPAAEQLQALQDLINQGTTYVDFCMWGPHGSRALRAKYFEDLALAFDVSLKCKEMKGTTDFMHSRSCWAVFFTAMLTLGQCLLPAMDAYAELIEKHVMRYGATCWSIIYQAETRLRREQPNRHRSAESRKLHVDMAQGCSTEFNADEPWGYLFYTAWLTRRSGATSSRNRPSWYVQESRGRPYCGRQCGCPFFFRPPCHLRHYGPDGNGDP